MSPEGCQLLLLKFLEALLVATGTWDSSISCAEDEGRAFPKAKFTYSLISLMQRSGFNKVLHFQCLHKDQPFPLPLYLLQHTEPGYLPLRANKSSARSNTEKAAICYKTHSSPASRPRNLLPRWCSSARSSVCLYVLKLSAACVRVLEQHLCCHSWDLTSPSYQT